MNKENPFLFRYAPNTRFFGAFKDQVQFTKNPEIFGESITDKESYRLNLSSQRGAISALQPGQQQGWYMFEDGKYDVHKDFSALLRKDLSIVDIDHMTEILKTQLEMADEKLAKDIKSQLKTLEDKKAAIEVKENTTTDSVSPSE